LNQGKKRRSRESEDLYPQAAVIMRPDARGDDGCGAIVVDLKFLRAWSDPESEVRFDRRWSPRTRLRRGENRRTMLAQQRPRRSPGPENVLRPPTSSVRLPGAGSAGWGRSARPWSLQSTDCAKIEL